MSKYDNIPHTLPWEEKERLNAEIENRISIGLDTETDRVTLLKLAFGDIPYTDDVERMLTWLAGWDIDTVKRICSMVGNARLSEREPGWHHPKGTYEFL